MIIIAEPYARFARTLAPDELEPAARRLLEFADRTARGYLEDRYERFGITVVARIETGSTRMWVTIGSLVTLLTQYGSLRQSADYLIKDGRYLGTRILSGAPEALGISEHAVGQQKRLGVPGQLRRLFAQVEQGEISSEEATRRALTLLERSGGADTMRELPRLTQQLSSELAELRPERGTPKAPVHREGQMPDLGLPPSTPQQRRRGAIASRDSETGEVHVATY